MIYTDIMVPIEHPGMLSEFKRVELEPYMFDEPDRFKVYRHPECSYSILKDDRNQWYFSIRWETNTLTEVKYARQVHRPSYINDDTLLKLVDFLEKSTFTPQLEDFDKAFIHTTMFVGKLDEIPLSRQLRIANADGEDDPAVVKNVHYIENIFNGQRTRFLAGFETYSIATITENRHYLEKIHLPASAFLYLQYFVYFQQYGFVPSKQMMARLLENLWASTQSRNTRWNTSLLTVEPVNS